MPELQLFYEQSCSNSYHSGSQTNPLAATSISQTMFRILPNCSPFLGNCGIDVVVVVVVCGAGGGCPEPVGKIPFHLMGLVARREKELQNRCFPSVRCPSNWRTADGCRHCTPLPQSQPRKELQAEEPAWMTGSTTWSFSRPWFSKSSKRLCKSESNATLGHCSSQNVTQEIKIEMLSKCWSPWRQRRRSRYAASTGWRRSVVSLLPDKTLNVGEPLQHFCSSVFWGVFG